METLTADRVPAFVRDLEASDEVGSLKLDLRNIRLQSDAASLLSSILLGPLGDHHIRVHVSSHNPGERVRPRLKIQFEILFALANRRGTSSFSGISQPGATSSDWNEDILIEWRNSWTPGWSLPWRELFAEPSAHRFPVLLEGDHDELFPDIFGRYNAAFVNPHRGSARSGRSDLNHAVCSWMSRVLPDFDRYTRSASLRQKFVADVGAVVEELVENVRDWAPTQADGQASRCLVRVFVTRGSDHDRLHLSVLDTGPGISATAQPRCQVSHPGELLRGLLTGSIRLARGRGFGLPLLWGAVTRWSDSDLWLFSGKQLITGIRGTLQHRTIDVDTPGTLFRVMFRLPQ